jgi:hypothetical protein
MQCLFGEEHEAYKSFVLRDNLHIGWGVDLVDSCSTAGLARSVDKYLILQVFTLANINSFIKTL